MSSEQQIVFTKENLDTCLKEVAREYRKLTKGAMPAELILVGGAAVLAGYGFREMTTDVDALILAASSMKDAVNRVGDRLGLPNGWLNADFRRTDSYSPRLAEYSSYYKTFFNVLQVRTISAEYLIAMKLKAGRIYKKDLSDVLGILAAHEKQDRPIGMEQIRRAVENLYGDWSSLPERSAQFLTRIMQTPDLDALYQEIAANEREAGDILVDFEQKYPGVAHLSNTDDILKSLRERQHKHDEDLER